MRSKSVIKSILNLTQILRFLILHEKGTECGNINTDVEIFFKQLYIFFIANLCPEHLVKKTQSRLETTLHWTLQTVSFIWKFF